MKKFFGVIFIIGGLIAVVFGTMVITNIETRNDTFGGRVSYEFNQNYREQSQVQQAVGLGSVGLGVVFFILGIVMVAAKSNTQRKKELELQMLKSGQEKKSDSTNNSSQPLDKNQKRYYTNDGTNQQGPFSYNELEQQKITEETPVWTEGLKDWTTAGKVRSLLDLFKQVTPPPVRKTEASTPPPIILSPNKTKSGESMQTNDKKVQHQTKKSKLKPVLIIGGSIIVMIVIYFTVQAILTNQNSSSVSSGNDNYHDRVKSVEEIEQESPLKFLSVAGNYEENFWGDKIKISCEVTNSATVAKYKDVVIEFSYYTKSETLIGTEQETVYEIFKPQETKSFNFKIPNYTNTHSLGCDIVDAKVKY